jgi:hypothetical protein
VIVSDTHYYEKGERIAIEAGVKKDISVALTPKEGGINVSATDGSGNALKGDLYVDGVKVGMTPQAFKLIVGGHEVEVRTAGGGRWSEKVEVKERVVSEVVAKLKEDKNLLKSLINFKSEEFPLAKADKFEITLAGKEKLVAVYKILDNGYQLEIKRLNGDVLFSTNEIWSIEKIGTTDRT